MSVKKLLLLLFSIKQESASKFEFQMHPPLIYLLKRIFNRSLILATLRLNMFFAYDLL